MSNLSLPKLPSSASSKVTEQLIPERRRRDEKSLRNIIRDMGLKVTDQRLLILKALHSGRAHVTAQEVFETVTKQDSSIGFATVYRFLRKLTDEGFVTEMRMGGSSARYELKPEGHHDHLTCVQCGKICEFENDKIEELQEQVAKKFGFRLTSHVLELYGICPDCQKSKT
jgi:Fur family ferric uptake transcriptional regulator